MMKHIKDAHGNIPCHKFMKNQCDYGSRCLYSHPGPAVHDVHINRSIGPGDAPYVPAAQDFPEASTNGPVVGAQERPHPQIPAPALHQMSQQDQQSIPALTSQMVIIMNQMNQIQAALSAMS